MKIGIIGAGIAGLTAAHDLARAGHSVSVFEAAPIAGGLASGFRDSSWEWPLERFYHHLFETDTAIRTLVDQIGFGDKLFFRNQITAQWMDGQSYAISGSYPNLPGLMGTALSVLNFKALPFHERLRMGLISAYLKYGVRDWRPLERVTASAWTKRWAGEQVSRVLFQPLLEGKFGPYVDEVNMAWLWARFKARSFKLGYFVGGFQGFVDALLAYTQRQGVDVHLGAPVSTIEQLPGQGWRIAPEGGAAIDVDALIVTGAPGLLSKLAPQLPPSYLGQLKSLRSMGAVVLTIALKHKLLDQVYWLMPPKSEFPFLALVEHTNFIEPSHYGGDHLIYCGDYLEPSHAYFQMTPEQLLEQFLPSLKVINPQFDRSWVRAFWLHREPYAQPIVPVNHSRNIPPLATPLPGLFWASMSQVYPWDRGTNFAVELGQDVAKAVLEYARQNNRQASSALA